MEAVEVILVGYVGRMRQTELSRLKIFLKKFNGKRNVIEILNCTRVQVKRVRVRALTIPYVIDDSS